MHTEHLLIMLMRWVQWSKPGTKYPLPKRTHQTLQCQQLIVSFSCSCLQTNSKSKSVYFLYAHIRMETAAAFHNTNSSSEQLLLFYSLHRCEKIAGIPYLPYLFSHVAWVSLFERWLSQFIKNNNRACLTISMSGKLEEQQLHCTFEHTKPAEEEAGGGRHSEVEPKCTSACPWPPTSGAHLAAKVFDVLQPWQHIQ